MIFLTNLDALPQFEHDLQDNISSGLITADQLRNATEIIEQLDGEQNVEKRIEIVYAASVVEKLFSLFEVFFEEIHQRKEVSMNRKINKIVKEAGRQLYHIIFGEHISWQEHSKPQKPKYVSLN